MKAILDFIKDISGYFGSFMVIISFITLIMHKISPRFKAWFSISIRKAINTEQRDREILEIKERVETEMEEIRGDVKGIAKSLEQLTEAIKSFGVKLDTTGRASMCLLADQLKSQCELIKSREERYITEEEYKTIEMCHISYKELKGNGFIDGIVKEVICFPKRIGGG